MKFKTEGSEFAKTLRSLEQFVRTVKGQNKSVSDPKTSLVLGEIENDVLVFYYQNDFNLQWTKIVLVIEKIL